MISSTPQLKIQLIERSLRCFALGILALVPVIGLPLVLATEIEAAKIRRLSKGQWNPAAREALRGLTCARIAIAMFLLEVVLVAAIIIAHVKDNN